MTTWSQCRTAACKTRVDGFQVHCPVCNGTMLNSQQVRRSGWILLIVGGMIVVPTIFILLNFLPVALNPELAVREGRFGGTAAQVPLAVMLLLTLFAFALSMTIFGAQRAFRATRSALQKPIILLLGILFLAQMFYFGSQLPDTPGIEQTSATYTQPE